MLEPILATLDGEADERWQAPHTPAPRLARLLWATKVWAYASLPFRHSLIRLRGGGADLVTFGHVLFGTPSSSLRTPWHLPLLSGSGK